GIYRWQFTNPTGAPCDVAIMLTWNNDHGGMTTAMQTAGTNTGLVLQHAGGNATSSAQGEFTLAASSANGVTVSYETGATVAALQTSFSQQGVLANKTGNGALGAIAVKATVQPGATTIVPVVLAWDIPFAKAGTGSSWYREYTRYYGHTGVSSWTIA